MANELKSQSLWHHLYEWWMANVRHACYGRHWREALQQEKEARLAEKRFFNEPSPAGPQSPQSEDKSD